MAFSNFRNGFNITTKTSIDKRILLTKAEMLNAGKAFLIPDNYFCICTDDGKLYIYNAANEEDAITGKYREVSGSNNISAYIKSAAVSEDGKTLTLKDQDDKEINFTVTESEGKVKDIQVDGVSILNTDTGVANIELASKLEAKQDVIEDLATIRSNASEAKTQSETNKTAIEQLQTDIANKATEQYVQDYVNENGGKINKITVNNVEQTITEKTVNIEVPTKTSELTNDSNFVSNSDLNTVVETKQNKITAENKLDYSLIDNTPTIPSKTSELENDSNFITNENLNSELDKKQNKIDAQNKLDYSLIDNAPTIPTKLSELTNDQNFVNEDTLNTELAKKQNEITETNKLSYNLLSDTPTIPTKTSELTNDSAFVDETKLVTDLANKQDSLSEDQLKAVNSGITTEKITEIDNKLSTIPTKTSDITNDSGFITTSDLTNYQTKDNLTTELTESSTDIQYPSAKSVVDYVNNHSSTGGAVDSISINNINVDISEKNANIATDNVSVLYDNTSKKLKLPDTWITYLTKQTFAAPAVVLSGISNKNVEYGETVTGVFKHRETNIDNINGNLTFYRNNVAIVSDIVKTLTETAIDYNVNEAVTSAIYYKLECIDTLGTKRNVTISFNCYKPSYYGANAAETITDITGFTKKANVALGTIDITLSSQQYVYFVVSGTISKVTSGGFEVPVQKQSNQIDVDLNGNTVKYNVYRTEGAVQAGDNTFVIA